MNCLNEFIDAKGIKAETLISLLDIHEDFNVHAEGIFSRNYSEDLINVENENENENEDGKITLFLSRDGIFHLLPQGLFFKDNQLKIESNKFEKEYREFEKQKKAARSFFQPFDTAYFKLNLELEQKFNDFAKTGNRIFTDSFGDNSGMEANNEYISKIKRLLPFASQIRGNLSLLIDILENIVSAEKIEIKKITPFYTRFIIHKEGLTKKEYQDMDKEVELLFDFLRHWFLPVEQQYDYRIKDYKQAFNLENTLILDYNTHL